MITDFMVGSAVAVVGAGSIIVLAMIVLTDLPRRVAVAGKARCRKALAWRPVSDGLDDGPS